ncbi:MAG: efflux transporter outer membrane subunit [Bacteroidales bacterium]
MNLRLKINTIKAILPILLAIMVLVSCKVTENYKRPSGIAESKLYRDVKTDDTTTIADIPWKHMFSDTLLQGLIQEGINNNLDLKIAMARIKQAQANLAQSNAAFYPTLAVNASGSVQKTTNIVGTSTIYQLYGSTSWEADIWGKLKSSKRAALSALLQSDAYKRAVQTQLVSDIATDYYTLLAYDGQLQVTLKTVENRKLSAVTMKQLKESDVVTGAAVVQSEANRYSVEVTVPDLRQNIRETENALSILLGRNPGGIARDSLNNQQIRIDLQTGVPAQLLANRPDVQEAEHQLRYYFELTNVARTYFYPSLTLTATGGLSNASISQLFSASSLFGNILGGLVQPIFNHGLNKQRLRVAQAQQEEYIAVFKKILLNAGLEVSNALYNYQVATDKMKIRSQQIDFLKKSVEFTKELLIYSENTNYTDVLTSEQNLLAAQLNSINDKVQQLQSIVALYRSLGGGWE